MVQNYEVTKKDLVHYYEAAINFVVNLPAKIFSRGPSVIAECMAAKQVLISLRTFF